MGGHFAFILYSLHALLEDRVPPGLTDDQIGPLDNDNADKECRVAGELHDLPLLVGLGDRIKWKQFRQQAEGPKGSVLSLQTLTHCWP